MQKNLNIEKIAFIFRIVHLLLTFIESYYNFLSSDLYKNDTFQEIYFHLLKVFFLGRPILRVSPMMCNN